MFDFGTNTGFPPVASLVGFRQRTVLVGPLAGKVFCLRPQFFEPLPLCLGPAGAIPIEPGFLTMQQIRNFLTVVNIRRRDAGVMNQSGLAVGADVQFHTEVPVFPLLGLMHLWITRLILILDRGWCSNQGGINNRAAKKFHAVGHQQLTDSGEERGTQLMGFQQMTEVHQRRGIQNPFVTQVDPAELPENRNIVQGILTGHVAQVEPVGNALHPQYPFQTHRRPTITRLRVVRFNQRAKLSPRHQAFHTRQKLGLARSSTVFLKPSCRRQCHLLHRFNPRDQFLASDIMTKESFTLFVTCSAFP